MKVLKFGGTSVGSVDSLRNVKQIVEEIQEPVIVVVSALGGLTDRLIATARKAEASDETYTTEFEAMLYRHRDIINALVPEKERESLIEETDRLFQKLENVYKGIFLLEELSSRSFDKVVSFGERLSSRIISHIINDATLFDSTKFIKTVNRYGKHLLNTDLTLKLVHETFDHAQFKVAIVPGFIATDSSEIITNLGRGGSDYTAAILAAALDAEVLEIWTDVDGFLTADPRIVSNTRIIPSLSFTEAMELCNFGAKVIYPPTIYPVFHKNIPIYIKNTFNATAKGTCIQDLKHQNEANTEIKGVSSITDTCLLTVDNQNRNSGFTTRFLNTLTRNGISILLVSDSSGNGGITLSLPCVDLKRAMDALNKEFEAELETGEMPPIKEEKSLATLAVVADNMRNYANLLELLESALRKKSIEIHAISQGVPETSIAFVVSMNQRIEALQTIHDEIFT